MRFTPLIEPSLPVGKRCEVAHRLIDQLCEQLFLGGSLRAWQVSNALTAIVAQWERYPRDEGRLERRLIQRFEHDHVEPCKRCNGTGTVRK